MCSFARFLLLLNWVTFAAYGQTVAAGGDLEYDENLARRMAVLSAAAYSKTPEVCLKSRFRSAEVAGRFEVFCDSFRNTTCSGYIGVLHEEQVIAVVFRGTVSSIQMYFEVISGVFTQQPFRGMGLVNAYFRNAYLALWESGMADLFKQVTAYHQYYRVWVTGHSLGAAIATICSADLATTEQFPHSVHYNFGAPRVGNRRFAEAFERLLPHYFRIVHAQDVITTVYPEFLGYHHHHVQIWYNNSMSQADEFVVCYGDPNPDCPVAYGMDMDDHRHYFGVGIPTYGKKGCPTPLF